MVTAKIVTAELGIPRSTLYRLVETGKVPAEDVTKDWHTKKQYRFRLADVREALDRIKRERPH